MKILIITSWYPPDTAIAAVRPYMFAKYLSRLGHSVTVFRSGAISQSCDSFFEELPEVRVISYLGEDSPAEKFSRGEWKNDPNYGRSRIFFLPEEIRLEIAKLYHWVMQPLDFMRSKKRVNALLEQQKKALENLKEERFDVIFSTFGEAENIFAGQFAGKLFQCPVIQDFRDPVAVRTFQSGSHYRYWKKIQDGGVLNADACTAVSEDLLHEICSGLKVKNKMVLYNGYEPVDSNFTQAVSSEALSFCYTGQLYGGLSDFSPLLKAIQKLSQEGKISLDHIKIHYAGKDFELLHQKAAAMGVEKVLINHGYVGRTEAAKMQAESDFFVVLSWNTTNSKGILTGKFYEGIRAKKPIISIVSGDAPRSELYMINEKYHYGFCYEMIREKEQFQLFCDFLENAYHEKMQSGNITHIVSRLLAEDFRYDVLAKCLETLCFDLIDKK